MTASTLTLNQTIDILIDELQHDDELRAAFFRNPMRTLRQAADWMPITDSELQALCSPRFPVWERVAAGLQMRMLEAA